MATPSPLPFALLLLLLLVAGAGLGLPKAAAARQCSGCWQPIKDVNDPRFTEIAHWAVSEHNQQSGQNLTFVRVVSGKQQVVAGMNYNLRIKAQDGGKAPQLYEALVYERTWESFRSLTSFNPTA